MTILFRSSRLRDSDLPAETEAMERPDCQTSTSSSEGGPPFQEDAKEVEKVEETQGPGTLIILPLAHDGAHSKAPMMRNI